MRNLLSPPVVAALGEVVVILMVILVVALAIKRLTRREVEVEVEKPHASTF